MTRSKLWIVGLLVAAPVVAVTASVRPMRDTTPPLAVPAAPAVLTSEWAAPLMGPLQKREPPKPTQAGGQPPSNDQASSQVADEEFAKGAYPADTPGLVKPRVLQHSAPRYTPDAMRAKLQGTVEVEIIVTPDGTVGKARIKQSLDSIFGLDAEALKAALTWTFIPGTINDLPVPVHTLLTLEFRLH